MDLTGSQRKAAFAVAVVVLAGLGVFLLISGSPSAQTSHRSSARQRTPAAAPPTSSAPAVAGSTGATSVAGGADIYRWLPFSQAGLTSAAAKVTSFLADYATYSYTESAQAYVARMRGLLTPELAATLARSYATPGVAQVRDTQRQSSTGSGQVTALRSFGHSSLTFVATLRQRTTGTQGASQQDTSYTVTLTGAGASWLVADIELASAGNS